VLVADYQNVRLNPEAVTTDVAEFEAALRAAGREADPATRADVLSRAIALYCGELLPGCYEDWVLSERERMAQAYLSTLRQLAQAREAVGEREQALDVALRAVQRDPLSEEARADLMRQLHAAGQPEAALRQYDEFERVLQEEMGETPSSALRALARQVDQKAVTQTPRPAPVPPAGSLAGTVTFLLTDIEGTMALRERDGLAFEEVFVTHQALLRNLFREHGSHEVREADDGFIAVFGSARDALACAVAAQRATATGSWPGRDGVLRLRMALHTGDAAAGSQDLRELILRQATQVLAASRGGQILCSETTAVLLRGGDGAPSLFQVGYEDSGTTPSALSPISPDPNRLPQVR
jgi:tetratricopeptide (TPR) repeat protein